MTDRPDTTTGAPPSSTRESLWRLVLQKDRVNDELREEIERLRDIRESPAWIADCMRWHGKVLTGAKAHWCFDWDELPVDETTSEFDCCTCYPEIAP